MRVTNWILKRKVLILAILVLGFGVNAQNASYIIRHKTISTELSEQYGIPSSVIMAVALVESSAGEGKAAKRLNNHFGMVGKNHMAKTGYHSRYKQYDDAQSSFIDFCRVISNKDFYARLRDNTDPKEWVKEISKAGYSEKPIVWEKRILNTISANKL